MFKTLLTRESRRSVKRPPDESKEIVGLNQRLRRCTTCFLFAACSECIEPMLDVRDEFLREARNLGDEFSFFAPTIEKHSRNDQGCLAEEETTENAVRCEKWTRKGLSASGIKLERAECFSEKKRDKTFADY